MELFDAAMKRQTEIMVDNILGEGIDIHLLGLREIAAESGEVPEIFQDETYNTANHFTLSTSQVSPKLRNTTSRSAQKQWRFLLF